MKLSKCVALATVALNLVSCAIPDNMREVQIVDSMGNPLTGVERYPKNKLWNVRAESNGDGKVWVYKRVRNDLFKDGYKPLTVADDIKVIYVMQAGKIDYPASDEEIKINWNQPLAPTNADE